MKKVRTIILAAGEGTRMKSKLPKVLHKILDRTMINYVLDVSRKVSTNNSVIVVGHRSEMVKNSLQNETDIQFVTQEEQLGTGHAVKMAEEFIEDDNNILILFGDTPLIEYKTIEKLLEKHNYNNNDLTLVSAKVEEPTGYGRILRKNGLLHSIVEEKDASKEEKIINEINTGVFCFKGNILKELLFGLENNNSQGEFYITDTVSLAVRKKYKIDAFIADDFKEFLGVNSRLQLLEATNTLKNKINKNHLINGVTIIDSNTTYISKDVIIGEDTIIYPNVIIEGKTTIGENCIIKSNSSINDSTINDNVKINSSIIENSCVGDNTTVGPFAYLRPNTKIGANCKIGDFVEIKNSTIGNNTSASHLTYIGDSEVGNNINFGCGTVTVNYDGNEKHKTIIEDNCFIGCNSNLVAPITIHKNSYIGAGSTITKNVPKNSLAISRTTEQTIKENYKMKKD